MGKKLNKGKQSNKTLTNDVSGDQLRLVSELYISYQRIELLTVSPETQSTAY